MANSIPFRTTASLGPQLNGVSPTIPYWDTTLGVGRAAGTATPSYKLGTAETGDDGGEYFWVQASAAISATATTGTQVIITFPAYTVATGAGGFYTPVNTAIAIGAWFHVRRGAYNAVPA